MAKASANVRSTKSDESAAKTPSPKLTREWHKPPSDWIPIGRAVFRFGIADSDSSTAAETSGTSASLSSIEALKQWRSGDRVSIRELANNKAKPPSLGEITELLQDKTHARTVDIDQENGNFTFCFDLPGGGASAYRVTPWVLLAMPEAPLTVDPRIEAEALFNTEGLVRISDEEAAHQAQQNERVREAIGLVWRRYMLRAFDRAVSAGRVALYARMHTPVAPLRRLPADVWPILEVLDWQHGIARDPEGAIYYSIHAASTVPAASPKQKIIIADENAATKALAEELKLKPAMSFREASSWYKSFGFWTSERRFRGLVLPNARELAGLPRLGRPGRKKNLSY
jgi:hypothetical protein